MCDGECPTMRFLEHFSEKEKRLSEQKGQPNKVDTIMEAIRSLNAAGCDVCPCKDAKLKETCDLENCACLPPVIHSLSQEPVGVVVIAMFVTFDCLPLTNDELKKIADEAERLEQTTTNLVNT